MQEWIGKHGFTDPKALVDYAMALSTHYGEAIGALSCEMYEATALAQGAFIPVAEPAATPTYGEVAKAVYGTIKQSEAKVPSTVGRLVKQVGADTTLKNAKRDGAEFAWIPHGDTCAFCITLASRGWQHISKAALKNGHAEHIHANCDCQYSVRFDGKSTVKGYNPDKYLRMYNSADPNGTPQEKINALRREIDNEKNLDKNKTFQSVSGIIESDNSKIKADKIVSGHEATPKLYKPNSVIDHINKDGKIDVRSFYGENGTKDKDIHTTNHGNPKNHNYGTNGEHAHDYVWDETGRLVSKTTRNITEDERNKNGDIL